MKSDPQTVQRFLTEARNCAMQMMENACYIQKELPAIEMPKPLRDQITKLCADLIGTKHDLIHEMFEIDELMASVPDSPAIAEKIGHVRQWIFMATMSFHDCVKDVQQTVELSNTDDLLSILLMESGANILNTVPSIPQFQDSAPGPILTPKERDELLAECRKVEAKRQAEAQAEAYDPESCEENEEDHEDADDHDPNCYAFYSEDSYPVGILVTAIRRLMSRPELTPETAGDLKIFLFAMERLPLVTPGVRMSLGLRYDMGGESDWIEIRMEDGEFTLSRGTWVDGDADTETVFAVTSNYRDGDAFFAAQFAQSFAECARDVCREVVIEDSSDEPFTAWNLKPDKSRWSSLPCSFL